MLLGTLSRPLVLVCVRDNTACSRHEMIDGVRMSLSCYKAWGESWQRLLIPDGVLMVLSKVMRRPINCVHSSFRYCVRTLATRGRALTCTKKKKKNKTYCTGLQSDSAFKDSMSIPIGIQITSLDRPPLTHHQTCHVEQCCNRLFYVCHLPFLCKV